MSELSTQEDSQLLKDAISHLTQLPQATITLSQLADMVGVSTQTLERWRDGVPDPTETRLRRRLVWLYHRSKVWFLRVCPFMVALWTPSRTLQEIEERDGPRPTSSFIKSVTFSEHNPNLLKCDLTLGASFDSIHFIVHSYFREMVWLSEQPDEVTTKHMASFRRNERGFSLEEGTIATIFIRQII
jgi:transcriptional regulator with XRE-family HTH domain